MIETGQNIKNNKSAMAFVPRGDSMWPFLKDKQQTVIIEKNILLFNEEEKRR